MKITKQEEYGLRCVLQLARAGFGRAVAVTEIAKCEGLSSDYVTKLLILLRKEGLVTSVRGIKGGYALKRPPEQITMGRVMQALGGFFYPKDLCSEYPGKLQECSHIGGCGIRPVWVILAKQIYTTLNRTTLADLLMEEKDVERLVASRAAQSPLAAVAAGF